MRTTIFSIILILATILTVGCERQGPAERAGEKIDEAAEEIANEAEDACEDLKENLEAEDTDC